MRHILAGAHLFDGSRFLDDHALVLEDGQIAAILPACDAGTPTQTASGIIAPAFIDLQVNGGGGLMVDGRTDLAALGTICDTHRSLGCGGILPTLITDTAQATAHMITVGIEAARQGLPGFLGLHLEGPHLDPNRKGAHDPSLIRQMTDDDLARLCNAARALPVLMITLAPEGASPRQIAALTKAGAIVSLGHSNCDYETARAAYAAGARCTTHLFNAMSQMGHRSPGLVGAVLTGEASAGLIADGIHVHPGAIRTALAARSDGIFLVTDCMAFAGTGLNELLLNDRPVLRQDGRLTLMDGTLAGADLRMDQAVAMLVETVGIAPARALAMATSEPARAVDIDDRWGTLAVGRSADLILLDADFRLRGIWRDDDWTDPLPV